MTVTDEDRKAAASIAVLVEMRELILAGRADHHAEPFAAHRQAAYIAGLERAAVIAEGFSLLSAPPARHYGGGPHLIATAIRTEIGRAKSPPESPADPDQS